MLDPDWVYFQIPRREMTFVTRIMEGCEYLGVVTTLNGSAGVGFIRSTADTAGEAAEVLQSLPIPIKVLTYEEALQWEKEKM